MVAFLVSAISSVIVPRAVADTPSNDDNNPPIPPELSNPFLPHSGKPHLKQMQLKNADQAPFPCSLVVFPPANVGGVALVGNAGVLCEGPIVYMSLHIQMYKINPGGPNTPFGPPWDYFAIGPVIDGNAIAGCQVFPPPPAAQFFNAAFTQITPLQGPPGTIYQDTLDEPVTTNC
ncbi:hypothetical protein H7H80_07935 [Mycobacterium interjectum]|nr:hypothetical protein [Mycobacterium interjectum]